MSSLTIWSPTMNSLTKTMNPTNDLPAQLQQVGLKTISANLDDFLARAIKARWSPRMLLEQIAQEETQEHSRRSLERRLRVSGIKKFKPMADFEWDWPTKIEREVIERALTLDLDRKSTRLNSSHRCISYAVFCLKKKKIMYFYFLLTLCD